MPIVTWLISHAAQTLTRTIVGVDGRTAHERTKGRKFNRTLVEFGERVHALRLKSTGKNKGVSRWFEGVWLGLDQRTEECMIGHGGLREEDGGET